MVHADHSPTHSRWSVEAGDSDGETEVLLLDNNGRVIIPIFIENENLISITIEFEYTVPFEASISAVDSLTIEGSSSEEFNVVLGDIDRFEYAAGTTDEFEIVGTVTSRQGLPVSVPGDSDSSIIDIEIPAFRSLEIDVKAPLDSIQAGLSSNLVVTVLNSGNVVERASEAMISGNCPLLEYDKKISQLIDKNIASGSTLTVEIPFDVASNHPTENCNLVVETIFVWSDSSQSYSDSVKIKILEVEVEEINEEDDEEMTITNPLPAPGALCGVLMAIFAALVRKGGQGSVVGSQPET
tara:strand:+ start:522 stop:1412 length:891 start_codon:yes stop_codon:yes gene_type:complete